MWESHLRAVWLILNEVKNQARSGAGLESDVNGGGRWGGAGQGGPKPRGRGATLVSDSVMREYKRESFYERVSHDVVEQAKDRGLVYPDRGTERVVLTDDDSEILIDTFGIEWYLEYRINRRVGGRWY